MRREDIRNILRRQPFEPIRVHLSDQSSFDVFHPDMVMVGRTKVVIGVAPRGAEFHERAVWVDPIHITRIEPIAPDTRKRRSRRRR